MRLIDAHRLFEAMLWIKGQFIAGVGEVVNAIDVFEQIKDAPTVDAIEVVRCKDCKHWHREIHNGIEYVNFNSCDLKHYGDGHNFYCADAERRTNG